MTDYPFRTYSVGAFGATAIPAPGWLSRTSPLRGERAVVSGGSLRFCDMSERAPAELPDWSDVTVWYDLSRGLLCCRTADLVAHERAAAASRPVPDTAAARAAAEADAARKAAEEARERDWLARFRPPFRWRLGHKPVYSGLTRNSAGDGANRASVDHVMLDEAFVSGRLSREAGEMLCSPGWGSYGNEPTQVGRPGAPTCRRCLDLAARFLAPAAGRDAEADEAVPPAPGP